MKILLDLQNAQEAYCRGMGRWTLSVAKAMIENSDHEFWLLVNTDSILGMEYFLSALQTHVPPERILRFHPPLTSSNSDVEIPAYVSATHIILHDYVASVSPDVVYSSGAFTWRPEIYPVGNDPRWVLAITFYDLIPFLYPNEYLTDAKSRTYFLRGMAKYSQADCLVAISESSRREAIEHLQISPESVCNASSAPDDFFTKTKVDEELAIRTKELLSITRPFVFYTSGECPRKNSELLIQAYAKLSPDVRVGHQLVITCSIGQLTRERWTAIGVQAGLGADELILTGAISDHDLLHLYHSCALFVFPSWHEGFGLPILEAMSCGALVIGSNRSSVPEILQAENTMFDPFDTNSMAVKIEMGLTNPEFRNELLENTKTQAVRFSWKDSAAAALAGIERIVMLKKANLAICDSYPIQTGKARLAFVSPIAPDLTMAARYCSEILPELSLYYNIEIVSDQVQCSDDWINANFPLRQPEWFSNHANSFDRIVYQLGGSVDNTFILDLLSSYPGVVVLHDQCLSRLLFKTENLNPESAVFSREIWRSHGWQAFHDTPTDSERVIAYPCNEQIFENARAVILSSAPKQPIASKNQDQEPIVKVIPLAHRIRQSGRREEARKHLGIESKAFIIACFNANGSAGLNAMIASAEAHLRSSHPHVCFIHLTKENLSGGGGYSETKMERMGGFQSRVLESYDSEVLQAADAILFLLEDEDKECVSIFLDFLASGFPVISNGNNITDEFPSDTYLKLGDGFESVELAMAIASLIENKSLAKELGTKARKHVARSNNPAACIKRYVEVIEEAYAQEEKTKLAAVIKKVRPYLRTDDDKSQIHIDASRSIAWTFNNPNLPARLIYDITELAKHDSRTGIQRVVKGILLALFRKPWDRLRTELSMMSKDGELSVPLEYAKKHFGLKSSEWPTETILPQVNDIFLGIDLVPPQNIKLLWEQSLRHMAASYFVVYDLLPILKPQFFSGVRPNFENWIQGVAAYADGVICISRSCADDLIGYLKSSKVRRSRNSPLKIGWFHLGADFTGAYSVFNKTLSPDIRKRISDIPTFLMVSTIEPRKGHIQALGAFEALWDRGVAVNLVIVGKEGWLMEAFCSDLRKHPEFNKNLLWFESAPDDTLAELYALSNCVLSASEGEGFGLSLIEAAIMGIPILCRDLPVFREVAGDHATYFGGLEPLNLADAVENWLHQNKEGNTPSTHGMPHLSWAESCQCLRQVIIEGQWYMEWSSSAL